MKESLPKIVVLDRGSLAPDSLDWSAWDSLEASIEYFTIQSRQSLRNALGAVALLTNKVVIPREIMSEKLPNLSSSGSWQPAQITYDLDAARASNIVVSNARDYGTESVAQHTWMLILSSATASTSIRHLKSGAWSNQPFFALLKPSKAELTGQTLGIIGLGDPRWCGGSKAHAFGMNRHVHLSLSPKE